MTTVGATPASVFLSHAHEDRSFARRIAADLRAAGVRVWIDETEMHVGDALLGTLTEAIGEMDYLAVVISPHSARSDWVAREVEIALAAEESGRLVKVLPLLRRGGEVPAVLAGKTYADFTSEVSYAGSLEQVLARLGAWRPDVEPVDRLTELAGSHRLLAAALAELRGNGLSNATADALVGSTVDDLDLAEFLDLVAQEVEGDRLFGLALSLPAYIDQRAVGHRALDRCLEEGRLTDRQLPFVGQCMSGVRSRAAVVWLHSRFTSAVRDDPSYQTLLTRHTDVILQECADEMMSYLLSPNRGPGNYNVDSMALVMERTGRAEPFDQRWVEWIRDGFFDRDTRPGHEAAFVLYRILSEHWSSPAFGRMIDAIETRVHLLLKSSHPDDVRNGFHHLVAMVDAPYRGASRVLESTVRRIYDLPYEQRVLLDAITDALVAVSDLYDGGGGPELERAVRDRLSDVHEADRSGFTGHWSA